MKAPSEEIYGKSTQSTHVDNNIQWVKNAVADNTGLCSLV